MLACVSVESSSTLLVDFLPFLYNISLQGYIAICPSSTVDDYLENCKDFSVFPVVVGIQSSTLVSI